MEASNPKSSSFSSEFREFCSALWIVGKIQVTGGADWRSNEPTPAILTHPNPPGLPVLLGVIPLPNPIGSVA